MSSKKGNHSDSSSSGADDPRNFASRSSTTEGVSINIPTPQRLHALKSMLSSQQQQQQTAAAAVAPTGESAPPLDSAKTESHEQAGVAAAAAAAAAVSSSFEKPYLMPRVSCSIANLVSVDVRGGGTCVFDAGWNGEDSSSGHQVEGTAESGSDDAMMSVVELEQVLADGDEFMF